MTTSGKQFTTGTAFLMMGTALLFDFFQFIISLVGLIPVLGTAIALSLTPLVSLIAFLTFWLWFKMYGISFSKKKRGVMLGVGAVFELFPYLNALPAWTLAVWRLTVSVKLEQLVTREPKETVNSSPQSNSPQE